MSGTPSLRPSFALGLALAAATALWWLGASRLALEQDGNSERVAGAALFTLVFTRGLLIATLGARAGVVRGLRAGFLESLAMIAPGWPFVTLAWAASSVVTQQLVAIEVAVVAAAIVLPAIGVALRHTLRSKDPALVVASLAGIALAAFAWASRGSWWMYHG